MPIFDIYLLETVLNGLLFGGVLALLALGLNLVFGVIDVVWICYAELMMVGMYTVYFMYTVYKLPLVVAFAIGILVVAVLGVLLHVLVIRPVLNSEPINQLLVTGGVLFFLQAAATLAFGVQFRNLGLSLPSLQLGEIYLPYSRIFAALTAFVAMTLLYFFLKKTYLGTAIRAISQDRAIMPLMGVSPARIYIVTSAIGGGLAGLGACLLVLQYDVHPAIGLSFGPITFLICVLGGLGNMVGGFVAAFIFAQLISVGIFFHIEWGYVMAFLFFIVMMFVRPQGSPEGTVTADARPGSAVAVGLAECRSRMGLGKYPLHLLIMILLWSFVYTSWSLMGRFGLVSFGHGAFMGAGAYVVTMLWNHFGVTPWIGIPLGVALAVVVAVLIGYPCFRFRITGHYFALVTLALTEVARLVIVALSATRPGARSA
jgi:branched-chain amino acid transport system permease protein